MLVNPDCIYLETNRACSLTMKLLTEARIEAMRINPDVTIYITERP